MRSRSVLLALVLSACSILGGAEITVDARNDSDFPMTVQVVEGFDAAGNAFGPEHVLGPLEERRLELAVPGGEWHVSVNGARLMDSSDAAGRRGRLPVTLIVPAPDHPVPGPYWEAPVDWAGSAP
jgi:hypothetical protein